MLDIIDQLTFTGTYHILDEGSNWVKVTSRDLEVGTGFDKIKIATDNIDRVLQRTSTQ